MSHKRERASDPPDAFFMDEEGRLFRFSLRIDAPYTHKGLETGLSAGPFFDSYV